MACTSKPSARPNAALTSFSTPARRILLVEDNQDLAEVVAAWLGMDGHTVTVVHDGRAALEAMCALEPEVVLLDIGLPGMNGYEVARQMRAVAKSGEMTIVAMSGYATAEDRRRSAEAGCDAHFMKPVDPDALRRLLSVPRDLNPSSG